MSVCLVVEDEPLARRKIRQLLHVAGWTGPILEADTIASARQIIRMEPVALAFLDIRLPDGDSLSLFDVLGRDTRVVFTTAFDSYAVTAFELQALDYLVKPFSERRFLATLERVRSSLATGTPDQEPRARTAQSRVPPRKIFARVGNEAVAIDLAQVDRIEGHDDHAAVWCGGRRYLVYRRLSELADVLAGAGFVRIHRSVVVNASHVQKVTSLADGRLCLTLSGSTRVVASKSRATEVRRLVMSTHEARAT